MDFSTVDILNSLSVKRTGFEMYSARHLRDFMTIIRSFLKIVTLQFLDRIRKSYPKIYKKEKHSRDNAFKSILKNSRDNILKRY